MTTTRAIAHNTIVQIIGKIISTLLGLAAIFMMTRYLGQEKFGWYITATSFLQFFAILIDFGLIPVTSQMLSEPQYDKNILLKNLLGFRFVTALILFASPLVALFFPYPAEVKMAIAISAISFFCVCINQIFIGFYQNRLQMHINTIGEVAGRVALVVGIWLLIRSNSAFLPIMGAIVVASIVYSAILWTTARKRAKIGFAYNSEIWRAIATKMWPIAISIIFNTVYLRGDTILLSLFKSQSEVGLYGSAYRVLDIYTQVAMLIMGLMLPIMAYYWSRGLKEEFKKYYQQSFDIIILIAIPILFFTVLFGKQIMTFVAGPEFINAGIPLQILSIAVFGVYLGGVFGHTAVSINCQIQAMWIYISNAVITLAGYLIFIPIYGMYGAAGMTVFSEIYAGIGLFLIVRYYSQTKLQYKTLAKIVLSGLIMALSVWPLRSSGLLLPIIVAPLIYAISIIALGVISKETIQQVVSIRQKN